MVEMYSDGWAHGGKYDVCEIGMAAFGERSSRFDD